MWRFIYEIIVFMERGVAGRLRKIWDIGDNIKVGCVVILEN